MDAAGAIPGAVESWLSMVESGAAIRAAGVFSPRSVLTYALRPELKTVRCPTLFLWGEKDTFGPPSLGYEMAALIPGSRCLTVPDAGHSVWVDQPEFCARKILSFLS
jgi:pimeloyl-ACP methyl ester carboxylesterase